MRPEPKFEKLMEVKALKEGDKVKLTNGSIASFVRLKQKNFIGIMDGKSYNIPVNMFDGVVGKAEVKIEVEVEVKKANRATKANESWLEMRNNLLKEINEFVEHTEKTSGKKAAQMVSKKLKGTY